MQAIKSINDTLTHILDKRKDQSLYRSLQVNDNLIDFCSNDYLSFARSESITRRVNKYAQVLPHLSGATGSRSISGDTVYAEQLEKFLAEFHRADAGLLFNSGYDANLGLFSCIAKKEDVILCDELVHASIIDGCRLGYALRIRFTHNDLEDLEEKLKSARTTASGHVFVAVESVYSMDGDAAPLTEIAELCRQYYANLIVDEAHATGVFGEQGRGLVSHFGLEDRVFARVHTFGKAIGCHGAVVVGSEELREYLINFARSFIFTTALPMHTLFTIRSAYEELIQGEVETQRLHDLVLHFKRGIKKELDSDDDVFLIDSNSPVQSLVVPGNERVRTVSRKLQAKGFDVRAIVSPSVPTGKERLRISLHLHNSFKQVDRLMAALQPVLNP